MVIIDSSVFFELTKSFEIVPYTQTKGMYEFLALSGTKRIKFFLNKAGDKSIACFGNEKYFFGKKMISIEGECYATTECINTNDIRDFYEEISKLGYDIIEVCSNAEYNFSYETALRQAGYLRPVGQFSMPATKIINLSNTIRFNQNWKRNIKKAYQNNLEFEPVTNPLMTDSETFVSLYSEMVARKTLHGGTPSADRIHKLCSNEDFMLFFVKANNTRIAALIIHQRNSHAGLFYATTSQTALELSASFFMYNETFNYLQNRGVLTFDMEKLVPSVSSTNSVFLFKNGIEGTYQHLNGEWSWYKKSYYRSLMYFVKKYLMKKREL